MPDVFDDDVVESLLNREVVMGSVDPRRQSRFLSLQEVADDLGESVETVRDWSQDGRLAPLYGLPNGKRKVLRSDYVEWLRGLIIDRRKVGVRRSLKTHGPSRR